MMKKHLDPTAYRIARDDAQRKRDREREKNKPVDAAGFAKAAFAEAAGKGPKGGVKVTAAAHRVAAKSARKVF
jgi:hypothetical protein